MPLKKLSKTKLSVLIFSVSILCLTLAFFLSGLTWKQIVNAFTTKSAGSTLTVNDWNGLINDFVKKSGDTMTGSLTAPQVNTSKMCLGSVCRTVWPKSRFGGMYMKDSNGGCNANPYTGACTCPAGYTSHFAIVSNWQGVTRWLYYCYK